VAYVLVSGLMGSGKTTISEYMADEFGFYRMHPGTVLKKLYPDMDSMDRVVRKALKDMILMYSADFAKHVLMQGRDVVIERQALKNSSRHILLDIDSKGAKKYWILPEAEPETRIRRVMERKDGFAKGLSYEETKRLVYGDMAQWERPDMFKGVEVIHYRNEAPEDLIAIERDLQCRFSV
jgi:cytidylate kinase